MSLAKILKGSSSETDIKNLLYKECLRRDTYSFETVKEKLTDLYEYVQDHNVDGDEFMKFFFAFYWAVYADKPRKDKVFHPSSIESDCERKLFYEFAGFEPTEEKSKPTGQTQMTFDVGTWYHTYIQMLLWKAGVLLKSEAEVVSRRRKLYGHTDGILQLSSGKVLLEIKTMNSYGFSRGKYGPILNHEIQAGTYATELGLDRICFIYINKDSSEIAVWFRDVRTEKIELVHEKIADVLTSVRLDERPERVLCHTDDDKAAKSCLFRTLCFKDPD